MFKSYAKKIASLLKTAKEIDNGQYDVYAYGFEVLLVLLFELVMVLAIGVLFNSIIQSIIFLMCYCPIRQFAGGYNVDSNKKSSIIFLVMFIIIVVIAKSIEIGSYRILIGVYSFVSFAGIFALSPVECRENLLNELEKKQYKKIARVFAGIVLIFIFIALEKNNMYTYAFYASSSLFWIFMMLVLGIIKNNSEN